MNFPIHRDPSQAKDRALAPYNFIELPNLVLEGEPTVDRDQYDTAGLLTGYIACRLTTESPLYTRAALNKEEYDLQRRRSDRRKRGLLDDKADFFYIDEASHQPVIPGSSLRGMLRTLAEIVGFAKIDAVSDALLTYRSVDTTSHGLHYRERLMQFNGTGKNSKGKNCRQYTPLMRAGYLQLNDRDEWEIYPAQEIDGTTFARIHHKALASIESRLEAVPGCKNARYIYFQSGRYEYQDVRGGFLRIKMAKVQRAAATPGKDLNRGVLARSGDVPSKNSEVVIFPKNEDPKLAIAVSDEMIDTYRAQITQEQERLLGPDGVLNNGQPIFYLMEEGKLVFFGHTMMMRLPYEGTPKSFVPEHLRNNEQTDLAEALFGYVAQKKPETRDPARAGRLYVSDATLCANQEQIWLEDQPLVPKILATPKPTTFQHYLVQRNPDPFQSGVTRDGKARFSKELADYTAKPGEESVIRGHKYYWHKGNVQAGTLKEESDNIKAPEADTQHTRIKPLASGVAFAFKIHFENLTSVELGLLLWVLTLPGEEGTTYRHKLGMGKPLGMGSIHLEPMLVLSDRNARYGTLFAECGWHIGETEVADLQPYLKDFEQRMLMALPIEERGNGESLTTIPRIRTLLTLLTWPGLPSSQTRYLEIEREDPSSRRRKINEYRERPVLPAPDGARQGNLDDVRTLSARTEETVVPAVEVSPPPSTLSEDARSELAADVLAMLQGKQAAQPAEPAADAEHTTAPIATNKAELQPGVQVSGQVIRLEESRVVVDLFGEEATLQNEEIRPALRDHYDKEERFPIGRMIQAQVKRINKRGRIQLTMSK